MNQHCKLIVFSDKAYNAIIDETFTKDPVETGGILLGHILDNGMWIVMEVLPPGLHSIHEYAYFEYDEGFVNYLANSVASKYEQRITSRVQMMAQMPSLHQLILVVRFQD